MPSFVIVSRDPYQTHVGWYAGKITGMSCLKHFKGRAQPMTLADLKYEGVDPDRSDLWCAKCAKYLGRKRGHEYVIQKADTGGFEVLDLTFPEGRLVVFQNWRYDRCQRWIEETS